MRVQRILGVMAVSVALAATSVVGATIAQASDHRLKHDREKCFKLGGTWNITADEVFCGFPSGHWLFLHIRHHPDHPHHRHHHEDG